MYVNIDDIVLEMVSNCYYLMQWFARKIYFYDSCYSISKRELKAEV